MCRSSIQKQRLLLLIKDADITKEYDYLYSKTTFVTVNPSMFGNLVFKEQDSKTTFVTVNLKSCL